jgi:putative FmdB family regulatory protein
MPIYVYRRSNGSTFEVMQSMSEAPLTEDPKTGKPVQRVLQAPAIHFKGKGFHNTDYPRSRRRGGDGDGEAKSEDKDSSEKAKAAKTAAEKTTT